jgi:dipeptidyl-peptidase-4
MYSIIIFLLKDLKSKNTTQITFDGEVNKIINGASDWVYEEEFGLVKAFQWSPDGEQLAYYKFDESNVKEFSMDMFKNELYPSQYEFKYPKAGEENSKVSLHLFDLRSQKTNTITFKKNYEYLPRMGMDKKRRYFVCFSYE